MVAHSHLDYASASSQFGLRATQEGNNRRDATVVARQTAPADALPARLSLVVIPLYRDLRRLSPEGFGIGGREQ